MIEPTTENIKSYFKFYLGMAMEVRRFPSQKHYPDDQRFSVINRYVSKVGMSFSPQQDGRYLISLEFVDQSILDALCDTSTETYTCIETKIKEWSKDLPPSINMASFVSNPKMEYFSRPLPFFYIQSHVPIDLDVTEELVGELLKVSAELCVLVRNTLAS